MWDLKCRSTSKSATSNRGRSTSRRCKMLFVKFQTIWWKNCRFVASFWKTWCAFTPGWPLVLICTDMYFLYWYSKYTAKCTAKRPNFGVVLINVLIFCFFHPNFTFTIFYDILNIECFNVFHSILGSRTESNPRTWDVSATPIQRWLFFQPLT